MFESLPDDLQLASHDDISNVVGVVVKKLESVSSHAELPKPTIKLPDDVLKRMLKGIARRGRLTEEQVLNLPYFPLVELIPVEDLDRLAIRHFGLEAGMPPSRNVAAIVRTSISDVDVASAHIMETRSGRLRMIMDATLLRTVIPEDPTDVVPSNIREATVSDCEELIRQINESPDSRY